MAPPRVKIPPLAITVPPETVSDYACEKCGHLMRIRRSREQQHWFYGCSQWPDCHFTFDADQVSGAPIFHTRYGIPFRAERKEGVGALFVALKKDTFNLEAGQRLEQAKKQSAAKRRHALKNMAREGVQARANIAAPRTGEEWLEFVLSERLLAVQEHQNEETLRISEATGLVEASYHRQRVRRLTRS